MDQEQIPEEHQHWYIVIRMIGHQSQLVVYD
jgi:hypothetical protein